MNKLMGFYELKDSLLPTIPWQRYEPGVDLDETYLWTIRTAVFEGDDLNLPRLIGGKASEAKQFAESLYHKLGNHGIVIYYPYFIAEKSGTLEVKPNELILEAVTADLWNLVTDSKKDVTLCFRQEGTAQEEYWFDGNEDFLSKDELEKIKSYAPVIRGMFRDHLVEGRSILLEWSFAYHCDNEKRKMDEEYLVFYEARTIG